MDIGVTLPQAITAVAALGTASFGLVDASKALNGGPSRVGFGRIKRVITWLFPADVSAAGQPTPLDLASVLETLRSNYMNGTPLSDQKAIAKSLIKLRLTAATAPVLAGKTGVDATLLTSVATKMGSGGTLTAPEADVLGRFDLILSTALDEGYQRADQRYRNFCKGLAAVLSVVLALVAEWTLRAGGAERGIQASHPYVLASIVGLLATPLAPIAKDLSTALQTAAKAVKIFPG